MSSSKALPTPPPAAKPANGASATATPTPAPPPAPAPAPATNGAAPAPAPAAAAPKPAPAPTYWGKLKNFAFYAVAGLVLIFVFMTLLDSFLPGASSATNGLMTKITSAKLEADWSGVSFAMDNLENSYTLDWVRSFTSLMFILVILGLLDTAVSNFTGSDLAAVGGFLTAIVTIGLIDNNAPLAIGLLLLGLILLRRDRDEGKSFVYYLFGLSAVLMFVHFFGRDWQSWSTDSSGKAFAKWIVGGYFNTTEALGPWIALTLLVVFLVTFLQDWNKDGTMLSVFLCLISGLIAFGFFPYIGKRFAGVLIPGGEGWQNLWTGVVWSAALLLESRESFARSMKAGKSPASSLIVMIIMLGAAFGLSYVFIRAFGKGWIFSYLVVSLIFTLILGALSGKKHADVGEANWKTWVTDMEGMLGDVVSHKVIPWLFYPTLLNMGFLILGLLILLGVIAK